MPFLTIDGVKLFYERSGSGPAFIFLHGIFGSSELYREFLAALSASHTVYAVDLPMHGRSGRPAVPLRVEDIARLVAALARRLRLRRPLLIGHSAGGLIAAHAAEMLGSRAILICPAGIIHRSGVSLWLRFTLKNVLSLLLHPVRTSQMIRTSARTVLKGRGILLRTVRICTGASALPCLRKEMLVIVADGDLLFPCSKMKRLIGRRAQVRVIRGLHDAPILTPARVLEAM